MQCEGEVRTSVYRFYDSGRDRLYVGKSADPWRRWREHVLTASWYPQVRHWTVTWYDTEKEAAEAEDRAIKGEFTQFNKAGAPEPAPVRFTARASSAVGACVAWFTLQLLLVVAVVIVHWGWLAVVTIVVSLAMPVPVAAMFLALLAPEIRRFGIWLERHVIQEPRIPADISWEQYEQLRRKRAGEVLALARERAGATVLQMGTRKHA